MNAGQMGKARRPEVAQLVRKAARPGFLVYIVCRLGKTERHES
jgi:hypothetical protein